MTNGLNLAVIIAVSKVSDLEYWYNKLNIKGYLDHTKNKIEQPKKGIDKQHVSDEP